MSPSSTKWWTVLLVVFIRLQVIWANVEKVIFTAPAIKIVLADAALNNLALDVLNLQSPTKRVVLDAAFPTSEKPHGYESWVELQGLQPGRRYELRVCWLATQPTSFWLNTFEMSEAFETPELIQSLSSYAFIRHEALSATDIDQLSAVRHKSSLESSFLFLRIQAAADYFSTNKTLMSVVPPVHADLVLDPYLLNIFPQSLVPTAGYIIIVAIVAWILSGWVQNQLTVFRAFSLPQVDTEKHR